MKTPSPTSTSNKLPRGVAVASAADQQMQKSARKHFKMIIQSLADIASHGKNEAARVSAMKELLDRGFGKNHLHVQQEAPPGTEIQVIFGEREGIVINGTEESA